MGRAWYEESWLYGCKSMNYVQRLWYRNDGRLLRPLCLYGIIP
jgi:hypothetical protein